MRGVDHAYLAATAVTNLLNNRHSFFQSVSAPICPRFLQPLEPTLVARDPLPRPLSSFFAAMQVQAVCFTDLRYFVP
jgi:hypothetical protein